MSRMWEVDPETRTKVRSYSSTHRQSPNGTRQEQHKPGYLELTTKPGPTAPPDLQNKRQRPVLRLRCAFASMGVYSLPTLPPIPSPCYLPPQRDGPLR